MKTNKNLDSALRKAKPFSDTKKWCGCFTPSEILALVEAGVSGDSWKIDYAKEMKRTGISKPMWFYFLPGKVKMHKDKKIEKKH
jgi:hypothetical protein